MAVRSSIQPFVLIAAGPPRLLLSVPTNSCSSRTQRCNLIFSVDSSPLTHPFHLSARSRSVISSNCRRLFGKLRRAILHESGSNVCELLSVTSGEQEVRRFPVWAAPFSMELSTKADGEFEQDGKRPPMFREGSYSPPSWASHLHPIPSSFVSLGLFPTPIHRWDLPGLAPGTELWVKRDDLTGMQLSGNKIRKLEFLMADAKAQGADCVITIGGIQSNHCRATAVAARYIGLDCYLILRTSRTVVDQDPGLQGNLMVERLVGAHIDLVTKEEYVKYGSQALGDMLVKRLKAEGRKPYLIPVGGSNTLGTWGYIEGVKEIECQLRKRNADGATHFDDIVMACGRHRAMLLVGTV